MILAVFYPSGPLSVIALATLMTAAVLAALWLRRRRVRSFWPYVIGPGALSWAALHYGGFHPALALVPIVPFMPHSARDLGLFDPREAGQIDTLNQFEHWWAMPVQFVLLLFGLANAGVPFEQVGPGTYFVLAGLLLGKPIGILLFSGAARLAGASLPRDCVSPTWSSLASPRRSALRSPSSSRQPHFRRERPWPKRRWERFSVSVQRHSRSSRHDF